MDVIDLGVGKIGVAKAGTDVRCTEKADVVLVPQTFSKEINLENEIGGVTAFSALYAAASLDCAHPVLCGCRTRVGSVKRLSVFTFAGGRLIDIADRTLNPVYGGGQEGDKIKVFTLSRLRLGLLIDTDVLFAGNWKKLAPHADAIAGISLSCGENEFAYLSALSVRYSKPFVVAFEDGTLLWGKP